MNTSKNLRNLVGSFAAGALLLSSTLVLAHGKHGKQGKTQEEKEQEIALADAPAPVQATLKRIAGANPIKEVVKEEDGGKVEYEAEFKVGGVEHTVAVTPTGALINVEKELKVDELPAAVRNAVTAKYPGATLKDAEAVYSTENTAGAPDFYEVKVKSGKEKTEVKVKPTGEIVSAK